MVLPCTKLLQPPAILKIRNHTGKSTKLQELQRKSPRFRCFSDFPRSCRSCFVSKRLKTDQATQYMVWPTLINGRTETTISRKIVGCNRMRKATAGSGRTRNSLSFVPWPLTYAAQSQASRETQRKSGPSKSEATP